MRKIIKEILVLLWKVMRVVLWKWLKPLLGRFAMYAFLAIGLAVVVVILATRL